MSEADIMEWMHTYRHDSARYAIRAVTEGDLQLFTSEEAALFFVRPYNNAITINCALR
jgi:hypothetical protein